MIYGNKFIEDNSINESYIKDREDIYYNKDKFDSGEINLCFITGHSGSGKTTMADEMQSESVEHYDLDDLLYVADYFTKEELKEYGDLIYSFFNKNSYLYVTRAYVKESMPITLYEDQLFKKFIKYAMDYSAIHKNKQYVVEGIWLYIESRTTGQPWFIPEQFDNYAFYIKGTSLIKSYYRAAKRNNEGINGDFIKDMLNTGRMKDYIIREKHINKFKKHFKDKMKNDKR